MGPKTGSLAPPTSLSDLSILTICPGPTAFDTESPQPMWLVSGMHCDVGQPMIWLSHVAHTADWKLVVHPKASQNRLVDWYVQGNNDHTNWNASFKFCHKQDLEQNGDFDPASDIDKYEIHPTGINTLCILTQPVSGHCIPATTWERVALNVLKEFRMIYSICQGNLVGRITSSLVCGWVPCWVMLTQHLLCSVTICTVIVMS